MATIAIPTLGVVLALDDATLSRLDPGAVAQAVADPAAAILRASDWHLEPAGVTAADRMLRAAYRAVRSKTAWDAAAFARAWYWHPTGIYPPSQPRIRPTQHDWDVYEDWYKTPPSRRWMSARAAADRMAAEEAAGAQQDAQEARDAANARRCLALGTSAILVRRFGLWLLQSTWERPPEPAVRAAIATLLAAWDAQEDGDA